MSVRPLPRVGERFDELTTPPFTQGEIAAYADVSGDDNPLHLDAGVAAAAGFAAPLAHGMLVMAAFEPALAAWRDDLRIVRLSAKFVQPILAGQSARISGRVLKEQDGGVLMRLLAQGPDRAPAIVAEAVLALRDAA